MMMFIVNVHFNVHLIHQDTRALATQQELVFNTVKLATMRLTQRGHVWQYVLIIILLIKH